MAKIGTLAGYNRVSEVPEDDYLMLENQLGFPLYVVALTYTQYIVMMALWQYGELSVKELGQVLRLDSGTLTPLLKKLELKGFLKRKRSRNDERVVMVTLSEEGHALRKKAIDVHKKLVASTQEVFTVHEAAELRKLLNKLLDTIDAAHGVINPEDIKR